MRPNQAKPARTLRRRPDEPCHCLALRQAARHVSQFYDRFLAATGLKTTQFSVLARLHAAGPLGINALAAELLVDRTTLGRNLRPLQRDGLIAITPGQTDRRSKELRLTTEGLVRLTAAAKGWVAAQREFQAALGGSDTAALHRLSRAVTAIDLPSS